MSVGSDERGEPPRAIVFAPPRRYSVEIEAGNEVGKEPGYQYLAPSPATRVAVSRNTKSRTSVFSGVGWEPTRITSTLSGLARSESERALVEFTALAAALGCLPHGRPSSPKRSTEPTLVIHHLSQFLTSLEERNPLWRNMNPLTCLRVSAIP
jgi:hypothetical protein